MIKAIIFDLGGVILNMKPLLAQAQSIFQQSDEAKLWEEINIEAIPLCKGGITLLQFWKKIAKKLGKNTPDDILKDLWIKDFENLTSRDKGVEKIVAALKKSYKLAILSNTIEEHVEIIKRRGIFRSFDVVILSNEVNLTKDEKDIFLLAIEKLGVKPEECVFIDDIQRFLEVAKSLGMKTILFKNSEQLKSDLRKFNVKI